MKRILYAVLVAATSFALPAADAQTAAAMPAASTSTSATPATAPASDAKPTAKPIPKKTVKKPAAKKARVPVAIDEEVQEPIIAGSMANDYQCELGNSLTIYKNRDDGKHFALKWGKRLYRMTQIDTSSGAIRFENHHYGLVWIGIPSKGILLDSKHGHQLANECKTAAQLG